VGQRKVENELQKEEVKRWRLGFWKTSWIQKRDFSNMFLGEELAIHILKWNWTKDWKEKLLSVV